MDKCDLCQQINNSLTKISNYRLKSLAQTILKLKGFKNLDINNTFEICENCKQGIENVSMFWENIPEARSEVLINSKALEELHEHEERCLSSNLLNNQEQCMYEDSGLSDEAKLKPLKIRIKLPRKRKKKDKPTSSITPTSEPLKQRVRHHPKRYEEFDIVSTNNSKTSNENSKYESNKSNETFLNNEPEVALIRLTNGQDIAKLLEVDNVETVRKLRIICLICCQIFNFEKLFQSHLREHANCNGIEGDDMKHYLYYCKLCDKAFAEHYAVRRHFKSAHTDERPLKCQYCEAHFKYKFNLDYHMAKHVPPTKHFECVFCKKTFLKRYELKIHLRTHTKEKPYKCEFCSFAFAHLSNLKAHKKTKHLNNSTIEQNIIPVDKFRPPKELLEDDKEIQLDENILDLTCTPIFQDFTSDLKNDNIENLMENNAPTVCEPIRHNYNNNLELAEVKNEYYKMGTFQLDSNILKMLPSATFLDLKKWPKSYQRMQLKEWQQTEKSRSLNKGNLNSNEVENNYAARELLPQTFQPERDTNNSTKSIIKYTPPLKKSSNASVANYNTTYNQTNTASFVADFNSTIASTKTTSFEVSCGDILAKAGEFIDISKLSKSKQNEIEGLENCSDISYENVSLATNSTQSWKVIKVSARPIKINNIKNLETSSINSNTSGSNNKSNGDNNINKNSMEFVRDTTLKFFETNGQQNKSTGCLVKSQGPNSTRQSLLKPGLTTQTILAAKPLITKMEILPPLNTLAMLQKNASLPTPPTNLIKPPSEYKHQCTYCHKYFKQKSALTKHLRTHTGEKPYKCNLCPKSYADASNYKKHKILHKNAAEALNIAGTATAYVVQNSPAYSTISDPDPDGIEIMQSLKIFQGSSTEEDDNEEDDVDIDDASCTSSAMESKMWQNALEQALNDDEIMQNIRRNLADINNAILSTNMPKAVAETNFSTGDPD